MIAELFASWWSLMAVGAVFALLGGGLFAGLQLVRRQLSPEVTWIVYGIALIAGLGQVWVHRSLVDNAFIHFRHASNVLGGAGPVFNAGEATEGVSALGWTLLLALGGLTGLEFPTVAIVLNVAAYIGLGALALRIGQDLWERDPDEVYVPFAAVLICVQSTITPFGTSGMETAVVALATLATGGALAAGKPGRAGAFAVLAVFLRPDHAVFWLAGLAALRGREALQRYLLPAIALLPFLGFKLWFYGSLVPNPFWALDAHTLPIGQGLTRLGVLMVGEHLWVVLPLFVGWWAASVPEAEGRLRRFATFGVGGHVLAVTAMGASGTYGQLYVTDIVLMLLGAEALAQHRTRLPQWAAAGLLGATIAGLPMIPPATHAFTMAQTHTFFPLDELEPVRVRHHTQKIGRQLRRVRDAGKPLTVATCCGIGIVGYTSGLEAVHTEGLTDAHLARTETVDLDYLRSREVDLLRQNWAPPGYRHLTGVRFEGMENLDGFWFTLRYDRERIAALRKHAKSIAVIDFEAHLDRYLGSVAQRPPTDVARDLAFFDLYYFDHNEDPGRRGPIAERAAQAP